MTSHRKDLSDDLIEGHETVIRYAVTLHLPLWSGSSQILKVMNRHYTKKQLPGAGGEDPEGGAGHCPDDGYHRETSRRSEGETSEGRPWMAE